MLVQMGYASRRSAKPKNALFKMPKRNSRTIILNSKHKRVCSVWVRREIYVDGLASLTGGKRVINELRHHVL
jgi:hypothetical protein